MHTLEKCSGTGRSWSRASRMPLSQRALKCSQRTRSTHLHMHPHQRQILAEKSKSAHSAVHVDHWQQGKKACSIDAPEGQLM